MAIVAWRKTRDVHQAIEVKKAKDKRIAEILIDEFQFCLAGLNKSGPVSFKIVSVHIHMASNSVPVMQVKESMQDFVEVFMSASQC